MQKENRQPNGTAVNSHTHTHTHRKYNIYHSDVINRFRKKSQFRFYFCVLRFIWYASSCVDASLVLCLFSSLGSNHVEWKTCVCAQARSCLCVRVRAPLTNFINKNDVKRFNLVIHLVKLLFTVSYSQSLSVVHPVLPPRRLSFNVRLIFMFSSAHLLTQYVSLLITISHHFSFYECVRSFVRLYACVRACVFNKCVYTGSNSNISTSSTIYNIIFASPFCNR